MSHNNRYPLRNIELNALKYVKARINKKEPSQCYSGMKAFHFPNETKDIWKEQANNRHCHRYLIRCKPVNHFIFRFQTFFGFDNKSSHRRNNDKEVLTFTVKEIMIKWFLRVLWDVAIFEKSQKSKKLKKSKKIEKNEKKTKNRKNQKTEKIKKNS